MTEPPLQVLQAGALAAHFGPGGLRWICWNGVEVLRAVQFLLRTPGWGTPVPVISDMAARQDAAGFAVSYVAHYGQAGSGVVVRVAYAGAATGTLTAEADIRAEAPFDTNRAGFVILHALAGFAGTEVLIDHASAPPRRLVIPTQISPGQPVFDIRAVTHQPVTGLTVTTRLEGDVFEMEDHRNWSDASFKTYSRPIGLPYPYQLLPGQPVAQSVTVSITDTGASGRAISAVPVPAVNGQRLPGYALPLDGLAGAAAALAWPEALRMLAPQWVLLRLDAGLGGADDLAPLAQLLSLTGARLDLVVILAGIDDTAADAELAALARRFAVVGVTVDQISAFAGIDAQSFQPGEPRPPHPSETGLAASLDRHFKGVPRIGGTPAFFTEFNRKRPGAGLWDALRFATTPVVHAADDLSVMETLQALPHIMASATALAAGTALSVGPIGIGARLNPYGTAPSLNPPEARIGMAARDPRARGLFAAAWTVGYLAQIAAFQPRQFAFGAPTGPFGLISTPQDYPRALWDDLPGGSLYPLYHVACWIAGAAGADLISAQIADGVAQIVWHKDRRQALIANLTTTGLPLPQPGFDGAAWCLDAGSLTAFAHSATLRSTGLPTTLDAYAVVFLDERGPGQ